MNVSDRRGNDLSTYAIEPVESGISRLQQTGEAIDACVEVIAGFGQDAGPTTKRPSKGDIRRKRFQCPRDRAGRTRGNQQARTAMFDRSTDCADVRANDR